VLYDVIRSRRADDLNNAACLVPGIPETQVTDGTAPKGIVFYLVGSHNDCGDTLADASTGPRSVSACR
jgi:hypothetical protein